MTRSETKLLKVLEVGPLPRDRLPNAYGRLGLVRKDTLLNLAQAGLIVSYRGAGGIWYRITPAGRLLSQC